MGFLRKKREKPDSSGKKSQKSAVISLGSADFDDVLSQNEMVVVDCWNPHCLPCRKVHGMMDEMAAKHGEILFGKLNTDKSVEVAVRYGVMSVPTVLVFRNGKKKGAITKITTESALERDIMRILEE